MEFQDCFIVEEKNHIYMNFLNNNGDKKLNSGITQECTIDFINDKFKDDLKFILIKTLNEKKLSEKYKDKKNPNLFVTKDLINLYYLGENNG